MPQIFLFYGTDPYFEGQLCFSTDSISLILHVNRNRLKYFIYFCFILGEEAGTEEYNYREHSILKWLILLPCLYSQAPVTWTASISS